MLLLSCSCGRVSAIVDGEDERWWDRITRMVNATTRRSCTGDSGEDGKRLVSDSILPLYETLRLIHAFSVMAMMHKQLG